MATLNWTDTITHPKLCVTFYAARTSPFTKHFTVPTDNDSNDMTKDEVLYYLDVVHANLDSLASNQLVTWEYLATATVYWNIVKSASITKNDCSGIYVTGSGTSVTYTVAANTYSSTTSQAAADALAQADVDNNKQAYANAHGSCTLRTTAWRGIDPFCVQRAETYYNHGCHVEGIRDNCTGGAYGSIVTRNILPKTYSSIISQADVDAQELADAGNATTNSAYFNTNGGCTIVHSLSTSLANDLIYTYNTFPFLDPPYSLNPDVSGQFFRITVNGAVIVEIYRSTGHTLNKITIHHGDTVKIEVRSMFNRTGFTGYGATLDYWNTNMTMPAFSMGFSIGGVYNLLGNNIIGAMVTPIITPSILFQGNVQDKRRLTIGGDGVTATCSFVHDAFNGTEYISANSNGQAII